MKIKMLEKYQSTVDSAVLLDEGITVKIFEEGDVLEVSDSFGRWLVDTLKAEEIKSVHYGVQPKPHDEVKYEEMRDELLEDEQEVKPRKKRVKK